MRRQLRGSTMLLIITALASLMIVCDPMGVRLATADGLKDSEELLDKAEVTFAYFTGNSKIGAAVRGHTPKCKAVLIFPQVLRAAFIFGAAGGSGVLLVHDATTGAWVGPAFYTMGEGSFGFQAGGDASEAVLLVMTDRGVNALLSTSMKLGIDASVAAGPVGGGGEIATENLSADIISYTRSRGLYAGLSLKGAVVVPRDKLNNALYGRQVKPMDVLVRNPVANARASRLIESLTTMATTATTR